MSFELIVARPPAEHSCILPTIRTVWEEKRYDVGTIWRCDDCEQLWVLVRTLGNNMWKRTNQQYLEHKLRQQKQADGD